MTVCIGALYDHGHGVIAVSDQRVAFHDFSGEHMSLKNEPFWRTWTLMCSGNDMSHVPPVVSDATDELRDLAKNRKAATERQVVNALHAACHRQLVREVEASVLGRFGVSAADFVREGKSYFTDDEHSEICRQIDGTNLDHLTFLLAGFDQKGKGHLWTVDGLCTSSCAIS